MNTPYDGRAMAGRVRATIARGRLVVDEGRPDVIRQPSVLVLADGATFEGYAAGHLPERASRPASSSSTPRCRATRR